MIAKKYTAYGGKKTVSKLRTNHLNIILSAIALSFHSFLIISAESTTCRPHSCCSSHIHGMQFPTILDKTTYFHIHISIPDYDIPLCCKYQVVLSCTCKEYSKDM